MSCTISLHDICAKIGSRTIFEGVNLRVSHKEKIAIIGANGAGKTTLLEIMGGLKEPQNGYVELFHEKISSLSEFTKFRVQIGFLFQNSDDQFLCPSVFDDVAFGLRARGETNVNLRVNRILESLEISHLKDEIVFELSGGEKKLVALAGVLVCEPKIILLDEPSAALDFTMQERITSILSSLDISQIIVSHDKEFIANVAQKIYYLENGSLHE